ncbi:hypothetical protein ACS0TY_012554 [Phlomoides rotata]
MEEQTYGVPFSSLGNLILDYLSVESCMDVMNMEANLLPDSEVKSSGNSVDGENEESSVGDSGSEVSFMVLGSGEARSGVSSLLAMTSEDEMSWLATDVRVRESEEDGSSSLEGDPVLDSSCSLSVVSDTSSLCGDDLLGFEANLETGAPFLEVQKTSIYDVELIPRTTETRNLGDDAVLGDSLSVDVIGDGASSRSSGSGRGSRSIFEVDCVPLWGVTSVCGRRPEMEDAVATVPRLLKIPLQMLIGDRVVDGATPRLSHLTGHFFGVYDGHGGSQVANYCRDRIHSALIEELEIMMSKVDDIKDNCEEQWRSAFSRCFLKVDDEVGVQGVAPETVGSTAVVAVVCSSHIIVANCGDSRAVLYRGKESMALSVDHKPNREDEYARIEAAGGKVIQWNGHRVFGVLAMSRSIGIV